MAKTIRSNAPENAGEPSRRAKTSAATTGAFRNAPHPQAPSTSTRGFFSRATETTRFARASSLRASRTVVTSALSVPTKVLPGVRRECRKHAELERLRQEVKRIVPDEGHVWRVARAIRVEHRVARAIGLVRRTKILERFYADALQGRGGDGI